MAPVETVERAAPVEFRVSGRTLHGIALRYGERARDRAERFEPGAFDPLGEVSLNLQHDPEREIASTAEGSLRLSDRPESLRVEADLREGSAELALVRRRALRGLSVEFRSRQERREGGIRVIRRAELAGIGLVDSGSYATEIELRQDTTFLRGVIPFDRDMECTCQGPDCSAVRFEPGAFDRLGRDRDVLAIAGRASEVLGSLRRGTLAVGRATNTTLGLIGAAEHKIDQALEVVITQAVTRAAATVAANALGAPFYVRPLIRQATSEFLDQNGVRVYRRADVRGFLVKPTINDRGQIPILVEGRTTGPIPPSMTAAALAADTERPERRRLWL